MPGLVPGIHVFLAERAKTWVAGTSPAMADLENVESIPAFAGSESFPSHGIDMPARHVGARACMRGAMAQR